MEEFYNYLYALLLTEILELILIWLFSGNFRFLEYMFFVNLLTNPSANLLNRFLILAVPSMKAPVRYFLIEGVVVAAEACLMRKYRGVNRQGLQKMNLRRCFLYSLGINGFSVVVGGLLIKMI